MRASQLQLVSLFAASVLALWPAPQSFTGGTSALWFDSNLKVEYNGKTVDIKRNSSAAATATSEGIVAGAVQRTIGLILAENLVPWKLVPRDAIAKFEPAANDTKAFISSLTITQSSTDATFKPLAGQVDESYTLCIETSGSASITAVSYAGVLHALNSFSQLFYTHSQKGAGIYMNTAPVQIKDAPKFSHRGLNIDVSRSWYPKADVLRQIDALSWNKFNRLHIHMTDAQSWPLEVPALPELTQNGAYYPGLYYTTQDLQDIQSYAQQRGVEVILEFDMPGHTSIVGRAYPNLIAAYDASPWQDYCAEPPCGQLKLNSSDVTAFLEKLFGDVLPRVSPYSSYFHTGGDEVNVQAILLDPTVKSNVSAVIKPFLQSFVDRNHAIVRKAGLTPVVWEEMITTWNLTLGDDVLVQTWISSSSLATVADAGHKVLFGQSDFWYLDCGHGQWLDFGNGASFQGFYPFLDYCNPYKNWKLIYSYDPLAGLTDKQAALVVGGEVHIWSEQTDGVSVDGAVWPRASAAGEIMWSGRQDASGQNRSQLDASPRLAEMRERMVARGLHAGLTQMPYCTQNNATDCSL